MNLNVKNQKFKKVVNRRWLLFIILLMLFLLFSNITPRNDLEIAKFEVLKNPYNPLVHLKLSQIAAKYSDWKLAKKELQIAYRMLLFNQRSKVAGLSVEFEETQKTANKKEDILKEIDYWKAIIDKQPGYLDGYLKLSLLYLQINEQNTAFDYWKKASYIDSNDSEVMKLGEYFIN